MARTPRKRGIPYYESELMRIDSEIEKFNSLIQDLRQERKAVEGEIDNLKKEALFQEMANKGLTIDDVIGLVSCSAK